MSDHIANVVDLRQILAEEIHKVRNEQTTAASVNAIVNASGKILVTVKMELDYAKLLGITPKIDFIKLTPLTVDERKGLEATG
ncbi:MAG: hypothetical protein V3R57_08310 [Candidatus Bathyarchaeia archaeon]